MKRTAGPRSATYVYAVVAGDEAPSFGRPPEGPAGTGPLRLLPAAKGLWLAVADAPLPAFGSEAIDSGLRDLEWVSARALAHERVVEHLASRVPTLPMRLFTLFHDDARAAADVKARAPRLRRLLARVRGREEWGLRLTLDPEKARALAPKAKAAPASGTDFLRRKQAERAHVSSLQERAREASEEAFRTLARLADDARERPVETPTGARSRLVLDAVFLVPAARVARLRAAAERLRPRLEQTGLELALSGPWPAYSFVAEAR